jgi:hypothetical protein
MDRRRPLAALAVIVLLCAGCSKARAGTATGSNATGRDHGVKFARCIRDNGVKDFPDPDPDGPLVDTSRIPSAATDGGMSSLRAAMQKCRGLAANAGVMAAR